MGKNDAMTHKEAELLPPISEKRKKNRIRKIILAKMNKRGQKKPRIFNGMLRLIIKKAGEDFWLRKFVLMIQVSKFFALNVVKIVANKMKTSETIKQKWNKSE